MTYSEKNAIIINRIKHGDKSACDDLIKTNDRLIHAFVKQMKEKKLLSHMLTYDDAYQICAEAMLQHCLEYDLKAGAFSTYMYWKFYSACEKERKDNLGCVRIPIYLHSSTEGRYLVEQSERWVNLEDTVCLENDDEILYEDIVPAPAEADMCDKMEHKKVQTDIIDAMLNCLHANERYILVANCGLDGTPSKSLTQIASELRISKGRVSQIAARSRRKLCYALHQYRNYQILDDTNDLDMVKQFVFISLMEGDYVRLKTGDVWYIKTTNGRTAKALSLSENRVKSITWEDIQCRITAEEAGCKFRERNDDDK